MSTETRIADQAKWVGVVPARMGTLTTVNGQQENGTNDLLTVPAGSVYRLHSACCFHYVDSAVTRIGYVSLRRGATTMYWLHYAYETAVCPARITVSTFPVPIELIAGDVVRIYSNGTDLLVVASVLVEVVTLGGVV